MILALNPEAPKPSLTPLLGMAAAGLYIFYKRPSLGVIGLLLGGAYMLFKPRPAAQPFPTFPE